MEKSSMRPQVDTIRLRRQEEECHQDIIVEHLAEWAATIIHPAILQHLITSMTQNLDTGRAMAMAIITRVQDLHRDIMWSGLKTRRREDIMRTQHINNRSEWYNSLILIIFLSLI